MTRSSIVRSAAAILLAAGPAWAQHGASTARTMALTLEDAVQRAIAHNPDLGLVKLETEVQAARVAESGGAFTPVFQTTLGHSSAQTPSSIALTGDQSIEQRDLFSSAAIRQRLRWGGGTWSASWDAARTATNSPLANFDPSVQTGLAVAFSQPLLKDRTTDAARHQYVIAARDQHTAELRFLESAVQTVAAVKQAYWTLQALAANVDVQERSLALAEELVRQNRVRVELGQAPPLDLVQSEAEVAERRENVIRATAAAGDAEDDLRRLIMDPADASFWQVALVPVDEPAGADQPLDVEAAVARAIGGRYDLARARQARDNAQTTVAFLRNQQRPDLRLEASYRTSGLGGTQVLRSGGLADLVGGGVGSRPDGVLEQLFTQDHATWSVGVTLSYPLGRSYEEAGVARASIERQQADQRIASLELEIAEGIRQAARQVRSTAERIEAARAGAELAEERFVTEQRRYEAGLSTSFLVTQAQRDWSAAQVNLLRARLDRQSALVSYESLQQAPPLGADEHLGLNGSAIVRVPTSAPAGVFRAQ